MHGSASSADKVAATEGAPGRPPGGDVLWAGEDREHGDVERARRGVMDGGQGHARQSAVSLRGVCSAGLGAS